MSFPRDLAITPMRCEAWNAAAGDYGPVYDEETGEYGPDYLYTETNSIPPIPSVGRSAWSR